MILFLISCGGNENPVNDEASTKPWDTEELYDESVVRLLDSPPSASEEAEDTQTDEDSDDLEQDTASDLDEPDNAPA